ncbi:hypothetical protein Pmani_014760 [Petrolisthes manimaculis]|uniref:Sphingomyelin phosphodiesterase n=1 Tax=Petrolisthes manimaculis TaxID=1843537 RepID=A0AAE1PTB6_9EUCA|nr:hypothetical protein Pmani_014760 [Petrolisthes manimaculis]
MKGWVQTVALLLVVVVGASSLASPPTLITPKGAHYHHLKAARERRLHEPSSGPEDVMMYPKGKEEKLMECLECEVAFQFLQGLVDADTPLEVMVEEGIIICVTVVGYTQVFCDGYVPLIAPILYHILSTNNITANDACGEILTFVGCTSNNPDREWTVNIHPDKPPVIPLDPTEPGPDSLKVLQLADTHYDPLYQPGANAACPEELCCREESGVAATPEDEAWYWGDYRHCGTPYWLLQDMLTHARATHPNIDYVIWTGDLVPHNMWSTSKGWNLFVVREMNQLIQSFFPDVPVFPVVGNHEMNPLDQFPDPDDEDNEALGDMSADWLYAELAQQWSHLVPDLDNSTVSRAAYYSVLIKPGFRLISFNTMFGYAANVWLVENSEDPGGELAWLEEELYRAEEAGELVHLLGHVPPGTAASERTWSREFSRIIERYENTVRAQFYGHTHYDEFEIFHDNTGRPCGVAYISPSQTPWFDLNPAYRIYYIDGDRQDTTRLVLDHETYITNLTEAHETGSTRWFLSYGAREKYQMTSLTPEAWQELVERMAQDRTLFDIFFTNYVTAGDPYLEAGCDDLCYEQRLCDLVTASRNDIDDCMAVLKLKRRQG